MYDFKSIKIQKLLLYCFFWFWIFPPRSILYIPIFFKVIMRVIVIFLVAILYFDKIYKSKKIDNYIVIYAIYTLYIILVTIIKNGYVENAIYLYGLISFGCIFFIYYFIDKKEEFFLYSYLYFFILILLNFAISLKYKNNFIFGNTNLNFTFYFLFIFFSYFIYIKNKKYLFLNILTYFMMFYDSYIFNATNTFVIILFYIVIIYVLNNSIFYMFLNKYVYIFTILSVFVFVVLPGSHSIITSYISEIFNKSNTLSGRASIYDMSVKSFLLHPIFGNGIFKTNVVRDMIGHYYCHNVFLEQLVSGGIIGFLLFLSIIYCIILNIGKVENKKKYFVLSTTLFLFILRNMFESTVHDNALVFTLLICISNSNII